MGKKRTNPGRSAKYLPVKILPFMVGEQSLTIYFWDNNPVELWAWNLHTASPDKHRWELHGLEKFPSRKQLEPALAYLAFMHENDRRQKGTLGAGKSDIFHYYEQWKASGFNKGKYKELKAEYLKQNSDDNAEERFGREMRRYKQRDRSIKRTK